MIVDTHAHYLPQEMLDDLKNRSSDFPSIECMSDGEAWKLGFAVGSLSRPIHPNLRNSDKRLRWMDEQQIDVQVCGGWPDSFGYEIPDAEGMRWSQFINEHLMKNCDASDHLAPLTSMPLQNGKMAAKILKEALFLLKHSPNRQRHQPWKTYLTDIFLLNSIPRSDKLLKISFTLSLFSFDKPNPLRL